MAETLPKEAYAELAAAQEEYQNGAAAAGAPAALRARRPADVPASQATSR